MIYELRIPLDDFFHVFGVFIVLGMVALVVVVLLVIFLVWEESKAGRLPGLTREEWIEQVRRELMRCLEPEPDKVTDEAVLNTYYGYAVSLAETVLDEELKEGWPASTPAEAVAEELSRGL